MRTYGTHDTKIVIPETDSDVEKIWESATYFKYKGNKIIVKDPDAKVPDIALTTPLRRIYSEQDVNSNDITFIIMKDD